MQVVLNDFVLPIYTMSRGRFFQSLPERIKMSREKNQFWGRAVYLKWVARGFRIAGEAAMYIVGSGWWQ